MPMFLPIFASDESSRLRERIVGLSIAISLAFGVGLPAMFGAAADAADATTPPPWGQLPLKAPPATGRRPFLYDGSLPDGIEPMERVVAVEIVPGRHEAWALALLRRSGAIESADLLLQWQPGQASALDKLSIPAGRDVGNVIVQKRQGDALVDVPYDVTFAFVFHAFRPNSPIYKDASETQGFK